MKKIRVGVIGLGFIGKQHVESLQWLLTIYMASCLQDFTAYFIMKIVWCAIMYNIHVFICQHFFITNNFHYEVSCEILKTGCHVYSEKPLTIKSVEGESLIELADKKGLVLQVFYLNMADHTHSSILNSLLYFLYHQIISVVKINSCL